MRSKHLKLNGVLLVSLSTFALVSCEKEEEEAVETDKLLGAWESGCGQLLTAREIDLAVNPASTSIEERLAKFYFKKTVIFENSADEAILENFGIVAPTTLNARVDVFYNEDGDTAAECNTDDLFSSQEELWTYVTAVKPTGKLTEVNVDNGFPENALAINFISSNLFNRTYQNSTTVDSLNDYKICESTTWAAETELSIADKQNCFSTALALTDAITDAPSDLILSANYENEAFKSEFLTGRSVYSIFLVDATTKPKTLKLGETLIDSDGSFTTEQKISQAQSNGDSEKHRHITLSEALTFVENP